MSEEQNNGLSQLEESTYVPKQKEDRLAGVAAPVLEDTAYVAPKEKKSHLADVAAPTLADDDYVDTRKKHSLEGVQAPVLEDPDAHAASQPAQPAAFTPVPLTQQQLDVLAQQRAQSGQPPYTPEQIAAIQKAYMDRQVAAHVASQPAEPAPQPQVKAPVLEESTYTPPVKEKLEPQVSAAAAASLLEEPAPEPERKVSRFNEADLEAAKANAQKRAIEQSLNMTTNVDKAESRRLMNELRMEREAELAKKGFTVVIVLMILGLLAAAALYFFSVREFQDSMDNGFYSGVTKVMNYTSFGLGVVSVLLILRVGFVKKLGSFLFGLMTALLLFPGLPMLMQKKEEGMALTAVGYGAALILCFAICFILSTSEPVNMFYKRKE